MPRRQNRTRRDGGSSVAPAPGPEPPRHRVESLDFPTWKVIRFPGRKVEGTDMDGISESEARLALDAIERRRQQVAAEIDVPGWYWGSVAAGWVALGVLTTYGPAWATT